MLNSHNIEHFIIAGSSAGQHCCVFEVKLHTLRSHSATLPPATHLIKFFIKLAELCHFLHDLLPHEEGGINGSVAPTSQGAKSILDECLFQEHQDPLKEQTQHRVSGFCRHHVHLLPFTPRGNWGHTGGHKDHGSNN